MSNRIKENINEIEIIIHYDNGDIEAFSMNNEVSFNNKEKFNSGIIVNDNGEKVISAIKNLACAFEIFIGKIF